MTEAQPVDNTLGSFHTMTEAEPVDDTRPLTDSLFISGITHAMESGILVAGKRTDRLNAKSLQQLVWTITMEKEPSLTAALEAKFGTLYCPFDPNTVNNTLSLNSFYQSWMSTCQRAAELSVPDVYLRFAKNDHDVPYLLGLRMPARERRKLVILEGRFVESP